MPSLTSTKTTHSLAAERSAASRIQATWRGVRTRRMLDQIKSDYMSIVEEVENIDTFRPPNMVSNLTNKQYRIILDDMLSRDWMYDLFNRIDQPRERARVRASNASKRKPQSHQHATQSFLDQIDAEIHLDAVNAMHASASSPRERQTGYDEDELQHMRKSIEMLSSPPQSSGPTVATETNFDSTSTRSSCESTNTVIRGTTSAGLPSRTLLRSPSPPLPLSLPISTQQLEIEESSSDSLEDEFDIKVDVIHKLHADVFSEMPAGDFKRFFGRTRSEYGTKNSSDSQNKTKPLSKWTT